MGIRNHHIDVRLQQRSVRWLWREREEIDFQPSYQRKSRIWGLAAKQFLIDSILNGFDVPKLYLADFSHGAEELNKTGQRYAVIDGKQRLEALFGFMDGEFGLAPSFILLDDPSLTLAGLTYHDLRIRYPELALRFENYELAVVTVVTDDQSIINQLFVRLNSSKPLTGAELRNAMPGRVPEIIRVLVEHEFFSEFLPFSTLRSEDKNLAAKLLLLEHRGAPVDTKKSQLDALVRAVGDTEDSDQVEALDLLATSGSADFAGSAKSVRLLLNRLCEIFRPRDPLLRQPGQIPVFYWFVRDLEDAPPERIRDFLENFQLAREENRRHARAGFQTNADLDRYEILQRSSNDGGSIKQRYSMLMRWWNDGRFAPNGLFAP